MCGGIVGALSMGAPARWSMHLAYNAGRIISYSAAGAIAGALWVLPAWGLRGRFRLALSSIFSPT
jgi:sulfite exporter TauE/SafE